MTRFADRARIPLLLLSFGVLLLVAASRPSAAKSPLGEPGWAPPDLSYQPSSHAVTLLLFIGYGSGALAVVLGLIRPKLGHRWLLWVLLLAAAALLTGPFGSGDHTNYAAYGRIALQGGDPYAASPNAWHGGLDPITASVQPPWQDTPSIYGPFATALMAVSSWIGGDNLRQTVWVWQIFVVAAWLGTRVILIRLVEGERAHGRIDVLWTFNPLVFGVLVLGAHVDIIAGVFVCLALLAARRSPLAAGLAVGAAASTKITYAVVALGLLWAWRGAVLRHPAGHRGIVQQPGSWSLRTGIRSLWVPFRSAPAAGHQMRGLVLGALAIIAPCYIVAGPHVLGQLSAAGGSFSYATPAAPLWRGLRHVLPEWVVTVVVFTLCIVGMIALAWFLQRVATVRQFGRRIPDPTVRQAVITTWALSTAYVLCAPYSLPWYDTVVWALLPLLLEAGWDVAFLGRYLFMTLAYVPGRVLAMSPNVEAWTLGFRKNVAPWAGWLALIVIVVAGRAALGHRTRPGRGDPRVKPNA